MVTSAKSRVTRKTSAFKSAVSAKRAPSKAARAPAKSPLKTAAKAPVKAKLSPQAKTAVKTASKAISKPAKVEKAKKPKMIRDSFTIPKTEYVVIDALKERAGKLSRAAKKSELVRAGVMALAAMPDAAFLAALSAVPTIKTGRPSAKT